MAGRGVDIVLGGAPPDRKPSTSDEKYKKSGSYKNWEEFHKKVVNAGGLHVIGTERHESRRIDNQLRGRSGRQGDPGSTKFYLSLEDDLMRIFGGEQISGIMGRLKLPEDQPIENKIVNKAVQQAQFKVESFHFDARKRLVEYDDVANQQREIIYKLRQKILKSGDLKEEIKEKLYRQIDKTIEGSYPVAIKGKAVGSPDYDRLVMNVMAMIPFNDSSRIALRQKLKELKSESKVKDFLYTTINKTHEQREKQVGDTAMRQIEKFSYLGAIDHLWIDHIDHIDSLRESIGIRAYGQRDPLVEFKGEAYQLFERLTQRIDEELAQRVFRVQVNIAQRPEIPLDQARTNIDTIDSTGLIDETADAVAATGESAFLNQKPKATKQKIGRNDPCWCGSGKKWKKCHYPQEG
jgi:preprotein translocase subunit SecA